MYMYTCILHKHNTKTIIREAKGKPIYLKFPLHIETTNAYVWWLKSI